MKKAPSTILATAGLTVGMLGFALPASATVVTPHPVVTPPPGGVFTPPPGGVFTPPPVGTKTPSPVGTKTPPGNGGKGGDPGKGGFGGGKGGDPGKGGFGGGKTQPRHHPKPVYHPNPKPTPTCHPQPKPPVKPFEYNQHSNKNKGYTTALYSWEHPKSGHIVKCDPKPVKHPVKHPAPPKHHHHAPKKHWWQGRF